MVNCEFDNSFPPGVVLTVDPGPFDTRNLVIPDAFEILEVDCDRPVEVVPVTFYTIRHNFGDGNGDKYCLILNGREASGGSVLLTPIGGGVRIYEHGIKLLRQELGISPHLFIDGGDGFGTRNMGLRVPGSKVAAVCQFWADNRIPKVREVVALHELADELGPRENGPLNLDQFSGACIEFAGLSLQGKQLLDRVNGGNWVQRLVLMDVFNVILSSEAMQVLVEAEKRSILLDPRASQNDIVSRICDAHERKRHPGTWIYFATEEEIRRGRTIPSSVDCLTHPIERTCMHLIDQTFLK